MLGESPGILCGSPDLLELLPDILRDRAEPFTGLSICFARNTQQFVCYPLVLCRFKLAVSNFTTFFGDLPSSFGFVWWRGFVRHLYAFTQHLMCRNRRL